MISKAWVLAQHGGPHGWLQEIDPAGCDFVRDGWSMPPGLPYCTVCPGRGCPGASWWHSSCCYIVNVHNHPSWLQSRLAGRGQLSMLTVTCSFAHVAPSSLREYNNQLTETNTVISCNEMHGFYYEFQYILICLSVLMNYRWPNPLSHVIVGCSCFWGFIFMLILGSNKLIIIPFCQQKYSHSTWMTNILQNYKYTVHCTPW